MPKSTYRCRCISNAFSVSSLHTDCQSISNKFNVLNKVGTRWTYTHKCQEQSMICKRKLNRKWTRAASSLNYLQNAVIKCAIAISSDTWIVLSLYFFVNMEKKTAIESGLNFRIKLCIIWHLYMSYVRMQMKCFSFWCVVKKKEKKNTLPFLFRVALLISFKVMRRWSKSFYYVVDALPLSLPFFYILPMEN